MSYSCQRMTNSTQRMRIVHRPASSGSPTEKEREPVEIGPQLPGGHLHLLTLSADSRNLACLWDSGRDYTFLVVDMVEGRERLRKVFRPGSWVTGGAFAPDASRAVLLTDRVDTSTNPALNRELRIYDAATGRELRAWKDPQAGTSFRGGCYSPDGRWLVIQRIRGADHRIVWLDAETLAEGASIRVEKPLAKAVFSRDGRQVAILQTMSRLGGLIDVWAVEPLLRGNSEGPSFRVSGLTGNLGNSEVSCDPARRPPAPDHEPRHDQALGHLHRRRSPDAEGERHQGGAAPFQSRRPEDLGRTGRAESVLGLGCHTD